MKRYILFIAALLCIAGCNDFLVEAPITSQSTELTLSTYDGLDAAVSAAYGPLASTSWYGADFIIAAELRTDNGRKMYSTSWDTGRCDTWYSFNYSASSTSSVWQYGYYIISAVNNVMDNLEGKGDEQDLNNLKAECLFLRAFCHFDILRLFAQPYCYTSDASHVGIPIILHTNADDMSARSSVAEVYEQIIADLLEAESIIDPDYQRAGTDARASATLEAIQAMLARVYLYSEQWANAATYATKVIESGKYSMWSASDMTDAACFTENAPSSGEIIFEVYEGTSNSYGGTSNENICSLTSSNKYGDAVATSSLINSYDASDVRGTLFHSATSSAGETATWTTKYLGKGFTNPDVNNTIILRLSDMYLIRAEATLHNNSTGYDALTDVNMVRSNRSVSSYTTTPTLSQIYEERRLEFAWEAQLWFDLGRTGRDMTRTSNNDGVLTSLSAGDYRWALAIPTRELQVNSNLVQNEGY